MSSIRKSSAPAVAVEGDAPAVEAQDTPTTAPEAQGDDVQGEAQGEAQGEGHVSASQIASRLGISPKDLRRWMRTNVRAQGAGDSLPGKGGRYAFDTPTADAIVAAYAKARRIKGTTTPGLVLAAAFAPAAPEAQGEGVAEA